jgi:signal transduction histidine kinase
MKNGKLSGTGAYSYSPRSAAASSDEAPAHVRRMMSFSELTASIAHEVNQPLTGIAINGEACLRFLNQDPPQLEELRAAIEDMISDSHRASEVIRRLRALSRETDPEHGPVDLNEVVRETLPLIRRELATHQISLKLDLAPVLPLVSGDKLQLQQVAINLITNAIQSMSQVTERARDLVVRTALDNGTVLLAVSDSGTGISPENMQKLFTAFFTTKPTGMGMGLSICCSIIDAHRGRIQASNNAGRGATFECVLPIEKQLGAIRAAGHTQH